MGRLSASMSPCTARPVCIVHQGQTGTERYQQGRTISADSSVVEVASYPVLVMGIPITSGMTHVS